MRRVMGAVAAAAAVTLTAAAAMAPALAATRPDGQHARPAHVTVHRTARPLAKQHAKRTLADVITSDFNGKGKYVTIVSCTGTVATPPPVRLARLNDPLDVRGAKPTAAVLKVVNQPKVYKTVYTCTVTVKVKVKVPKKKHVVVKPICKLGPGSGVGGGQGRSCHHVVLNTGYGGAAGTVAKHHPAG